MKQLTQRTTGIERGEIKGGNECVGREEEEVKRERTEREREKKEKEHKFRWILVLRPGHRFFVPERKK